MHALTQDLFTFIEQSPTAFHAAENARRALEAAGFTGLLESEPWRLAPGRGYYVTRNQSSLIAFRTPEAPAGFLTGAAHLDSPCLKLKEHMELRADGYTRLDAEKYGGMLMATWLDRPLSVAGRLMAATPAGVRGILVNLSRDLLVIPSLAIHMDRESGNGKKLDFQQDMPPLLGLGEPELLPLLAENAGVAAGDILSWDLYVYNRDRCTLLGPKEELILCPRLDDLQCAFALLRGFLAAAPNREQAQVLALFDSEEVGSQTRQGALSTFLQDVLRRICLCLGLEEEQYLRCVAGSLMVSADNAHGVHPAHPEKAALTNRPRPGAGVVVKYGPRYATDGPAAAIFRRILRQAGIPEQVYFNHSDIPGGGTLGLLSGTQVSMHTVDVGCAQLAMHAALETGGEADTGYLSRAMEAFYVASLRETGPEAFEVQ